MTVAEHKWAFPAVLVLLSINFFFFSATLRKGQEWGGDFAMYIHEAKNIAEGLPYADTGYIYNPARPIAPRLYPPVFPLLLAPIYKAFGLNLELMKLEILLFFEMALYVFWLIAKGELPPALALTAVAVLGFNPFFWQFNDRILSDIPFMFFAYLSLFLITRYYESSRTGKQTVGWAVLVGLCIYLACGARAVGLVLLPVLLLHDWVRQKKFGGFAMMAGAVCLPLIGLQSVFLGGTTSYFQMVVVHPTTVWANAVAYAKVVSLFWINGYSKWPRAVLFFGMYALAIAGFLKQTLRRHLMVYAFFLVFYLGVVFLWPYFVGRRLLIPLLPVFLLYAFSALSDIRQFTRAQFRWPVLPLLAALILASYVGVYSKADYGPLRIGFDTPQSAALFNFIRGNTPATAVFVFLKPRVLSLYTGRSAAIYPASSNDSILWNSIREIRASYLVTCPLDDAFFPRFISKYPGDLKRVYFNPDFSVYRIVHEPPDPGSGHVRNPSKRRVHT